MDNISSKLTVLKNKIKAGEASDKKFRADVFLVLTSVFGANTADLGVDFHQKNGVLFFKAKNKSLANELLLRKEKIIQNLKPRVFREVVIR